MQKDKIRDRLVELLQEADVKTAEKIERGEIEDAKIGWEFIADFLISNGVTLQEWIPVMEQLPVEEDEDVSGCVLAIERQDGFARRWTGRSVRNCPELFTHWIPLPESPKGVENETVE